MLLDKLGIFKNKRDSGHYLVSAQGDLVPLNTEQSLHIGRDPACHIVLNNFLVSRKHARLEWRDNHFVIEDLGSQNGTLVNNKRCKKSTIEHGDIITIGGYEFVFREGSREEMEELLAQQKSRLSSQETFQALNSINYDDSGFTGNLKSLSLAEIVQTLNQSLKTGSLSLYDENNTSGTPKAVLYFRNGEIEHAICRDKEGLEAVIPTLQLQEGFFRFKIDDITEKRTIKRSTMGILLEAHRLYDESNRDRELNLN